MTIPPICKVLPQLPCIREELTAPAPLALRPLLNDSRVPPSLLDGQRESQERISHLERAKVELERQIGALKSLNIEYAEKIRRQENVLMEIARAMKDR